MKLRWIDSNGVSNHDVAELPDLRQRTDGFLWLDIPEWSDDAEALLADEFKFHPMAISESRNRNHIPRLHVYPHHWFIVVHAPEIGARGHVHYLELDQFVGENFLVTIHGPLSPKVPLEAALRETNAVAARMESGRLTPTSPFGLTYAIVSSIARREADMVAEIAREVGLMEQRVMAEEDEKDPQDFLSQLFAARHELLTIKTMASQGSEIYRAGDQIDHLRTTRGPGTDEGRARPVRDRRPHQRFSAGVSDGRHRVLPCAYRHQDDHRRRAPRHHRSDHPPDHLALFCRGDERHRQRIHALDTARHPAVDHVGDIPDLAALGAQAGLVVRTAQ